MPDVPIPAMVQKPRRFRTPHPAFNLAVVEPIHQPLYSAHQLRAESDAGAPLTLPSEALMFTYPVGGALAGNAGVTATKLHTNMDAPGFLPTPKLFLVTGIRIIVSELTADLKEELDDTNCWQESTATEASGGNCPESDLLEDLLKIIYGGYIRFFVGTKDYFSGPTFFTPGNTGVGGVSSTALASGAATLYYGKQNNTFHGIGRYFALDRYPILVYPQQNFTLSINFPQPIRPSLNADRIIWGVLDGILGRETQ